VLQIQNWTTDTDQTQAIVLQDGSLMTLEIYFRQQQQGWFIKSLVWSTTGFTVTGLRITNNPNMLLQWKNIIPFGLACFTTDGYEPSLQQDFSSGASILYVLTSAEVAQLDGLLAGTTT
jgi:hypothetical protein